MKSAAFIASLFVGLTAFEPALAQVAPGLAPAPGYSALMKADYASAIKETREARASPYDPGRAINLGIGLAKSGQAAEAERLFRGVLDEDNVEMVVAAGATVMSHDVARRALSALQSGVLTR